MKKVYCSTGALIGRPNKRDYRLLKDLAEKLECDGFEFMVYASWYPEIDKLIETVKSFGLTIPVVHCEKSLSEKLAGVRRWYDEEGFHSVKMTGEEDRESVRQALDEFRMNLRIAGEFGSDRMVFHLWNGIVSDSNIERNIEHFGKLKDMAKEAGIVLMVENVICNTFDPMRNLELVHRSYPDVCFVYDTKMAEFHGQTMKLFEPEWEWMLKKGKIRHLHVNDYNGGIMDWSNLSVLPVGKGHVDFDGFFEKLRKYGYGGDYTVEATAFDKSGIVDVEMLNDCFLRVRGYLT